MGRKTAETPAASTTEVEAAADQFWTALWDLVGNGAIHGMQNIDTGAHIVVMSQGAYNKAIAEAIAEANAEAHTEGHDCQEDYFKHRAEADGLAEIEIHDGTVLMVAEHDALEQSVKLMILQAMFQGTAVAFESAPDKN